MNIELKRIGTEECERLWKMQVEAFSELLEKYLDYDISPANEPMSRVRERLEQPFTYYYYIMLGDTPVGAVRVVDMKDGSAKRISPVFSRDLLKWARFLSAARSLNASISLPSASARSVRSSESWRISTGETTSRSLQTTLRLSL